MGLESGERVGGYEIVGSLGKGGMSEVYRARDLTLGRDVAIKVLPPLLASDDEKRARFEREAQLLAALNHRNIAVIHGLQHDGDHWFLVLELVEGETLAERIKRGPLGLTEIHRVFLQIADAMEAAHDKGIIHRDLKPANVKIDPEGTVKLLDFGLGKELQIRSPGADKTATFEGMHTSPGLIMGTPGYMSPEQTRGQETARGTDVWSFGVTLFEALAGSHPFARETVPDMLSAILHAPPPWEQLPAGLPAAWRTLLERTLRKDEHDRLHDIADVRIELAEAPTVIDGSEQGSKTSGTTLPPASRWAVAALIAVGALVLWSLLSNGGASERAGVLRRFVIALPPDAPIVVDGTPSLAVSPDGTQLVYQNREQLYLRSLDQLEAVPIPGTQGGVAPFFSKSSDALGFFTENELATVTLPGGTPNSLAPVVSARGGSWSTAAGESAIVFSPSSGGGLSLVGALGGAQRAVASPEEGEPALRWPAVLPGDRFALATLWSPEKVAVGVVSLDSGSVEELIEDASSARFTPSGHIVFARGTELWAAAFDTSSNRLDSEPVVVVKDVAYDSLTGASFYDFADDGALFYVETGSVLSGPTRMFSVSRDGTATLLGPPRPSIQVPRRSPDGRFILTTVQAGEASDIWSFHLERGTLTRLTFDGSNGAAIWHPSGSTIAFSTRRGGGNAIFEMAADGSGDGRRLLSADHRLFPTSYSPDGNKLVYSVLDPETNFDIWMWHLDEGRGTPLLNSGFSESGARFSPDGRFIVYTSNESGSEEVYVRSVEGPDGRWQVSTDGGNEPSWARGGQELFYRSGTSFMSVDIVTQPSFEASQPRVLFDALFDTAGALYANYDTSPDGSEFVMIRSEADVYADRVHVVLHWLDELEGRVPTAQKD